MIFLEGDILVLIDYILYLSEIWPDKSCGL
jgi:hypothetical protein